MAAGIPGRTVLVTGGTGFVGQAVCTQLFNKGFFPIVVTRKMGRHIAPNDLQQSWREIKYEANTWRHPIAGIINLAGANIFKPVPWQMHRSTVVESRLNSTTILVDAIERGPIAFRPKVFINASGVGYYPAHESREYDESYEGAPENEKDFFTDLASRWEAEALRAKEFGARVVLMRKGVVLGEGGALARMRGLFRLGLGGSLGSGNQPFPWIHAQDVARLYVHALENESVSGPVNAVAPEHVTNAEFTRTMGQVMKKPTVVPAPTPILAAMWGGERARMLTTGAKVHGKVAAATGFKFQYPTLQQALESVPSLQW